MGEGGVVVLYVRSVTSEKREEVRLGRRGERNVVDRCSLTMSIDQLVYWQYG